MGSKDNQNNVISERYDKKMTFVSPHTLPKEGKNLSLINTKDFNLFIQIN